MRLADIVGALKLSSLVPGDPDAEITGAYVSDLLSDVMAHAKAGSVWVTIQTHQNVVAVASLLSLGAVIIAGGHTVEAAVIARAAAEGVPIYATAENAFTIAGLLYELGLR